MTDMTDMTAGARRAPRIFTRADNGSYVIRDPSHRNICGAVKTIHTIPRPLTTTILRDHHAMTTTPLTHYAYTYWQTLTTAITAGDWTTARTLAFNLPPEVGPIVIGHGAQLVAVAWPNGLPDLKTAPERPTAAAEDVDDREP